MTLKVNCTSIAVCLTVLLLAADAGFYSQRINSNNSHLEEASVALTYKAAGWELLDVRRIWSSSAHPEGKADYPHTAFTHLIRFRGDWYCIFREATNHFDHGMLRVIRSGDGKTWETAYHYYSQSPFDDFRDSKLVAIGDRKLVIVGHERKRGENDRRSITWTSTDGENWEGPFLSEQIKDTWIWWAEWDEKQEKGYGVAYAGKHGREGAFYQTDDFKNWELVADDIFPGGRGSEAAFFIDDDGSMKMLLRDAGDEKYIGFSQPPYEKWNWEKPSPAINFQGPGIIRLSDGRVIVGGRSSAPIGGGSSEDRIFRLYEWDLESNAFHFLANIPSTMDCGYPGFVEYDGELWISYYSSHEDPKPTVHYHNSRPSIYLARIKIGGARETR